MLISEPETEMDENFEKYNESGIYPLEFFNICDDCLMNDCIMNH